MQINCAVRLVSLVVIVSFIQGCGGGGVELPQTVPVSGKVIFNGAPLEGAAVRFYCEETPDRPATGVTNGEGEFRLTTFNTNDGAQPGAYKVTVTKAGKGGAATSAEAVYDPGSTDTSQFEMAADDSKNALPGSYASPATTPLKQTVTEAGPNDFTLEIE